MAFPSNSNNVCDIHFLGRPKLLLWNEPLHLVEDVGCPYSHGDDAIINPVNADHHDLAANITGNELPERYAYTIATATKPEAD